MKPEAQAILDALLTRGAKENRRVLGISSRTGKGGVITPNSKATTCYHLVPLDQIDSVCIEGEPWQNLPTG